MNVPQILTLNIDSKIVKKLRESSYTVYEGSLGYLTRLIYHPNANLLRCLLDNEIPDNLHEFDIIIIDLTNNKTVNYDINRHSRTHNKSAEESYIMCRKPQNVFDPRPYSLKTLADDLAESFKKDFLLIVFCSDNEIISYEMYPSNNIHSFNTYGFCSEINILRNKSGEQTKLSSDLLEGDLYAFLNKYNEQFNYEIIFSHPMVYKDSKYQNDPSFIPLIVNKGEEVVSFLKFEPNRSGILCLPNLADKEDLLLELLNEIAPTIFPEIFPENAKNSWLRDQIYYLPNHRLLIQEVEDISKNYNLALDQKNKEIEENYDRFKFLHQMLTETGDELVESVIKFLVWIGFEKVKNCDLINKGDIKEEDVQIETPTSLLVIEVKGIGGTSKDRECSQINKIKQRRIRERHKFDVFACYIVNHQRNKAPQNRLNPPFTEYQLQDAISDERGLVTTWQLFNLYSYIENQILTKEQVRESFYSYGYVDFIPKSYIRIGEPTEIIKDRIIVINIQKEVFVKVDDNLFIDNNGSFRIVKIESIRKNDIDAKDASDCEAGIRFNDDIKKGSVFYQIG